jgi:hypothetical protein
VAADRDALREQYLAAIEHEIIEGKARLARARGRLGDDAPRRARTLVAVSDVTIEWLAAERDRLRAGGPFDEDAARRFLGQAG